MAHVIIAALEPAHPAVAHRSISVFEEAGAAEWGREMELSFAHAMDADEILKLGRSQFRLPEPRTIRWPITKPRS